jgi:hypothetical protein
MGLEPATSHTTILMCGRVCLCLSLSSTILKVAKFQSQESTFRWTKTRKLVQVKQQPDHEQEIICQTDPLESLYCIQCQLSTSFQFLSMQSHHALLYKPKKGGNNNKEKKRKNPILMEIIITSWRFLSCISHMGKSNYIKIQKKNLALWSFLLNPEMPPSSKVICCLISFSMDMENNCYNFASRLISVI